MTNSSGKPAKRRLITGFGVALLFVLGFAVYFFLNFKTVVVSGKSMEPTFKDGQRLLVSQAYGLVGKIRNKDIVVLRDSGPTGYIIKRVYKMSGEKVDWLNAPESRKLSKEPFVVPQGMVYVLGDNRSHSEDSRMFGPVQQSEIIGKVVVIQ